MCSDSKLSRLCRLDDDFLRPYTESGVVLVAQERSLSLGFFSTSQALDSENGVAIGLDCKSDCMCPTKIATHLMVLLTVEGQNVKHLACNVLVAVSEFLVDSDDVLFKVLLQLLSVPFCAKEWLEKEKGAFQDSEGNTFFRISDIFNPVLLFHLFLLELSYDHQVLLHYLISEDTGISCAEYL